MLRSVRKEPAASRRLRIDAVAALLIWFVSGSPIATSAGNYNAVVVLSAATMALYGLHFGFAYTERLKNYWFLFFGFFAWATVQSVVFGDWSQWYSLAGHTFKILIVAIYVATAVRPLEGLVRSMVWIALVSLFVFFVRQILRVSIGFDIADLFDWFYQLSGAFPYRSIVIYNFDILREASRNAGPFREPGLFAAYLALALVLVASPYFDKTSLSRVKIIAILAFAILSTQSTTGLAVLSLLLVILYNNTWQVAKWPLIIVASALLSLGVILWSVGEQSKKVDDQLLAVRVQRGSWYTTRYGNALVDELAIQRRPWFGYGFSESGRPILWSGPADPGFGNGLTGTIVKFGLLQSFLIYFLFLRGLYSLIRRPGATAVAFSVFVMLLIGQQLLTLSAIYVLLGSNWAGSGTQRKRFHSRKLPKRIRRQELTSGSAVSMS